jgi:hypothetical protein
MPDIGGNPSPVGADFLTKELFRYIMAFGEEKHKWQAHASAQSQTATIANIARRQITCMRF